MLPVGRSDGQVLLREPGVDPSVPAYLLLVLAPGGVQGLDEGGGVADEHGVAGGAHDHAEHGEPDVRHAHRGLPAIPDAQHVAHGLEEGVGVLLSPRVVLWTDAKVGRLGEGWDAPGPRRGRALLTRS